MLEAVIRRSEHFFFLVINCGSGSELPRPKANETKSFSEVEEIPFFHSLLLERMLYPEVFPG